ncbi:FT-interacting protein 3 [Linum perenne]
MLAVWFGTQADEAFPDAWHSDAINPSSSRSKVYHSPRLWYVRVNVIEAQDLIANDKNRFPDAYVKVQIGNQILRTKMIQSRTTNPLWNEDLMFVAAEPFDEHLILSVEDRVGANKDESIGKVVVFLNAIEKRTDDRFVRSRWPKYPPHMNTRMSYADAGAVSPDELDEEFDTFPTTKNADIVRMRYDRLRSVAGRIQTVVGDVATQGERIQALLSWRDPRATSIFVTFCLVAAFLLYATPFQILALMAGVYAMRHPRFRHKTPAAPLNFFRRLPSRTDSML